MAASRRASDVLTTPDDGAAATEFKACNQSVVGHEEHPFTHNCVIPYSLLDYTWTPYHQTVCGFVHPVVAMATMVTNSLVCAVLLRPSMRSPTNILLVAIAVSNTITGLLPTPGFLVFYGFGLFHDWVPFNWCLPYQYTALYLPTVFHTASVWLTVALAALCCAQVRHDGFAKRLCTLPNTLRAIVVVYVMAFLLHLPRMLESRVYHVRVSSLIHPGRLQ